MTLDESELLAARILVVDDMPANVELLCAMLADAGYSCVAGTTNPREVAPMHWREPFDLILLDLQMPGMDGFEVMDQLKEHEPLGYLPVLVVTAQPSHKLRALQAGARDFVSKPFDILEIKTRIRNMLEVRLLHKRVEGNNRRLEQTVADRTSELRESEARFRALVELSSDWYWEQDEHGKFTRVAGPALEMLGLGGASQDDADTDSSDAPPVTLAEAQSHWNAEDWAQLEEKLATRKPFLDFVYRRVRADGSEQYLQTSGEPMFDTTGRFAGYRGIGMDITGRMRTPVAPGADRLGRVLDAIDAAVLLADPGSRRYMAANTAACRLTGYSREELSRLGAADIFVDAGESVAKAREPAGDGDARDEDNHRQLRRKDGTIAPVLARRRQVDLGDEVILVDTLHGTDRDA
ncbi:hypothetical protein BH11PSE14_BH11PSE14_00240 [soil metagenome]